MGLIWVEGGANNITNSEYFPWDQNIIHLSHVKFG